MVKDFEYLNLPLTVVIDTRYEWWTQDHTEKIWRAFEFQNLDHKSTQIRCITKSNAQSLSQSQSHCMPLCLEHLEMPENFRAADIVALAAAEDKSRYYLLVTEGWSPSGPNAVKNLLYVICKNPNEVAFAGFFGVDESNAAVTSFSRRSPDPEPRKVQSLKHVQVASGTNWIKQFCTNRDADCECVNSFLSYYISPLLTEDTKWERLVH